MSLNKSDVLDFSIHEDESRNMDPNKNLSHKIYKEAEEESRSISIDKISDLNKEFINISGTSDYSDLENIFQPQENNGKSIFNILFLY